VLNAHATTYNERGNRIKKKKRETRHRHIIRRRRQTSVLSRFRDLCHEMLDEYKNIKQTFEMIVKMQLFPTGLLPRAITR